MHQHQCGHANSWFFKSSSFWLDTPNTHINLYLHTFSLIILMQSDFPNHYLYKQTNVENIIYPLYIVSPVISSLLDISSLMHSRFILQSLIKASPLSNCFCSCKASHYFFWCKIPWGSSPRWLYRKTKQQSIEQLTYRRKKEEEQQAGRLHNPTTRVRKRKQKQQVTRYQAKAEQQLYQLLWCEGIAKRLPP
jgi:hypothetical protein